MFTGTVKDYRLLKERATFRARDCCYKCLLPQKVCQPNSEGRECLDKDLLGVFLVHLARLPEILREVVPQIDSVIEGTKGLEGIEVAKRMFEVDQELLGTETPKVVILFLHFCTRFKDQSEAKE